MKKLMNEDTIIIIIYWKERCHHANLSKKKLHLGGVPPCICLPSEETTWLTIFVIGTIHFNNYRMVQRRGKGTAGNKGKQPRKIKQFNGRGTIMLFFSEDLGCNRERGSVRITSRSFFEFEKAPQEQAIYKHYVRIKWRGAAMLSPLQAWENLFYQVGTRERIGRCWNHHPSPQVCQTQLPTSYPLISPK